MDVIIAPPGLAKTSLALDEIQRKGLLATYLVPRYDLAEEAKRRLLGSKIILPKIHLVDGKIDPGYSACESLERIKDLRDAGRHSSEAAVCQRCGRSCAYFNQFVDGISHRILVHDYAVLKIPWGEPDIIVIDEAIAPKLVSSFRVGFEELASMALFARQTSLGELHRTLDILIDLAKGEDVAGPYIVGVLESVGINLGKLEEDVAARCTEFRWANHPHSAKGGVRDLLVPFLRALREQADHRVPGRVLIRRHALHCFRRLPLTMPPNIPVVVLDSSADPAILKRIFEGRQVTFTTVIARPKLRLVQVISGNYGKRYLTHNSRQFGRILDLVREIVIHQAQIDPNSKVGIITFKALLPAVEKAVDGEDVVTGHFWAERGSNAFVDQNVTTLVVVGTPTPNVEATNADAAAFFWPESVHDGTTYEWRNLGMHIPQDSGFFDRQVPILTPTDPLRRAYLAQGRESEIANAVGRIRPFHNPEEKLVVVFSNMPIPHFPPTETCTLRELPKLLDLQWEPDEYIDKIQDLRQARRELRSESGNEPSKTDLARRMGVSRPTLYKYLEIEKNVPADEDDYELD